MTQNILLLCASPYKEDQLESQPSKYRFTYNGITDTVEGHMTNEGPAKYFIKRIRMKNEQYGLDEKLDKIIMICSETIRKKGPQLKGFTKKTHKEYFIDTIEEYNSKIGNTYDIQFESVDISDTPDEQEITRAVVEAVDKISTESQINLFIDFNGGQRYIPFLIINIANLMKNRGVTLYVTVMNFPDKKARQNEESNFIEIKHFDGIFKIDDLVSGIKEYINYGRTKTLKKYFQSSNEEQIKNILNQMDEFADSLQLCQSAVIESEIKELKEALEQYQEEQEKNSSPKAEHVLFSFIVNDILRECKDLFDGNLPEIIRWCLEKDFIQQALTFYAERMPIYFWESGIFTPTDHEIEKYYKELDEMKAAFEAQSKNLPCDKNSAHKYNIFYKNYDKQYSWLVHYLRKKTKKGESVADTKLSLAGLNTDNAKATTNKPDKIKQILNDYYAIKDIRNSINHAAAGQDVKKCADIKKKVERALNNLI